MGIWYVLALALLAVAAGVAAVQRSLTTALLCAGLACWVLPQAWSQIQG
jgi:hypothetical protein